jgi:pimeloyl-ACP methyl ester carboxylesterase
MRHVNTPFHHEGLSFNLAQGAGHTAIVFQHGLCGSAAQTQEVFPDDARFKLLTLECRGHGTSESGDHNDFSIATFASDVAAMFAARAKPPSIIGGISMGAAIALHLAVHQPHLVKALVLARPAWVTEATPPNLKPNFEVGELLAQHTPERAKAIFLQGETARHLAQHAPDNLASLTGFFTRDPIATTSSLLTSIASDGPRVTVDHLRNIKIPTLIIATGQDVIHPLPTAHALHELIPTSRLVTLTPKGENKSEYVSGFRAALLHFFEENA